MAGILSAADEKELKKQQQGGLLSTITDGAKTIWGRLQTPEGRGLLGSRLYDRFVQPVVDDYHTLDDVLHERIPMYVVGADGNLTTNPQVFNATMNTAMNIGGGSLVAGAPRALANGVDQSTLRMFAGPTAKTADLTALKTAQDMAAKGAAPEAIHDATKWFQGADGKWRFEIPDTGMSISKEQEDALYNARRRDPTTLGNVISHPELFAAYPQLANTPAFTSHFTSQGGAAMGADGIKVHPNTFSADVTTDDFKGLLAHETQHAVQDIEDFAKGGNPRASVQLDAKALSDAQQADRKALDELWMSGERRTKKFYAKADEIEQRLKQRTEMMNKIDALGSRETYDYSMPPQAGGEYYRRLAGEVEARNVQARMKQGYAKYPWETQDVPNSEQFVRGLLTK